MKADDKKLLGQALKIVAKVTSIFIVIVASIMIMQGIVWILLLLAFLKHAGRKAGLLKS